MKLSIKKDRELKEEKKVLTETDRIGEYEFIAYDDNELPYVTSSIGWKDLADKINALRKTDKKISNVSILHTRKNDKEKYGDENLHFAKVYVGEDEKKADEEAGMEESCPKELKEEQEPEITVLDEVRKLVDEVHEEVWFNTAAKLEDISELINRDEVIEELGSDVVHYIDTLINKIRMETGSIREKLEDIKEYL